MINVLTKVAVEESTYVIVVSFFDEAGNTLTPNSVNWTLTDRSNTVVNSKVNQTETPAIVVAIVLSGDDLQIFGEGSKERRKVLISGTYDSDYGTDLPYNIAAEFEIDNIGFILHGAEMEMTDDVTITEQVYIAKS